MSPGPATLRSWPDSPLNARLAWRVICISSQQLCNVIADSGLQEYVEVNADIGGLELYLLHPLNIHVLQEPLLMMPNRRLKPQTLRAEDELPEMAAKLAMIGAVVPHFRGGRLELGMSKPCFSSISRWSTVSERV